MDRTRYISLISCENITMSSVEVLASQAIVFYGWRYPMRRVDWKEVFVRKDMTVRKLMDIGFTEEQLFIIQPNKHEWISEKRLELIDITLVPSWKVHATRDMEADIVAIACCDLSAAFLQETGVSFEDLVQAGLTLNLMMIFKFDLTSWIHLGLYRGFIQELTDVQSLSLFSMPTSSVMLCVKEQAAMKEQKPMTMTCVKEQDFKR